MSNIPPPPQSEIPGQKKGMSTGAKVGIGCGVFVLLGVVAFGLVVWWGFGKAKQGIAELEKMSKNPGKSAAELMVNTNKDLEKISENDATGEMTIKVKSTGEEVTLKYGDLAKGRFRVKDKDGNVSEFGQGDPADIPAWVPRYARATDEKSVMHITDASKTAGILTFTTTDDDKEVAESYKDKASTLGLNSSNTSSGNVGGNRSTSISFSGGKRELVVNAFGKSGEPLTVQVTYSEKK